MCGVNGFHRLFELMVDKGASDLHLRVPSPPVLRIDGTLVPQEEGMQTLGQASADLVKSGIVSQEEAMMKNSNLGRLVRLLQFEHAAT